MARPPGWLRRRGTLFVSAAIVIGLYIMTREPALTQAESEEVVNHDCSARHLPWTAESPADRAHGTLLVPGDGIS